MTRTEKSALQLFNRGGVIPASDWTTGSGGYTKSRAVPAYCSKMNIHQFSWIKKTGRLHPKVVQAAETLLQRRPKLQKLVLVHDYDAVLLLSAKERLTN
jgi:hypothetical protein